MALGQQPYAGEETPPRYIDTVGRVSFHVAAGAYDLYMGRYSAPLAPTLLDFAGVDAGQMVLDVGCGPGATFPTRTAHAT
jgi:hypothetical protein